MRQIRRAVSQADGPLIGHSIGHANEHHTVKAASGVFAFYCSVQLDRVGAGGSTRSSKAQHKQAKYQSLGLNNACELRWDVHGLVAKAG
jgi:hypothetical protein